MPSITRAVLVTALSLCIGRAQAQYEEFVIEGQADAAAVRIQAQRTQLLARLTPVSAELLRNPPPGEWLHWRRTQDGHGYSPLAQIDRRNVGRLRLAWSWTMAPGPANAAPIVHDGVLFLFHQGDRLQALDAATGDLLWEYRRQLPRGQRGTLKRGIAIADDKLIFASSDNHMVALDIRTGEAVWDTPVEDWQQGWMFTSGPIVAGAKVIMGMSGCVAAQPGGCFIVAHDLATGREAWRFYTIARPGEPGGASWNGLPLAKRYGGSVWMPGTYDPELNLVYFGVGQGYPWPSELRGTWPPVNEPGISNDELYTNSTLALDPDSGRLVWHYQHLKNDTWDMDYMFERLIVTLPVNGAPRKLVVTQGKMAIIEALDARTGEFVFARDLGLTDIVTAIDPATGEKTIDRNRIPRVGQTVSVCPHAGGARSWPASGYNPRTRMLYMPLQEHCADISPIPFEEGEEYAGGGQAQISLKARPDSDGNIGRLDAFNLATRTSAWSHRERAPQSSAALPTAGGLVFQGSYDRYFSAYDDRNGRLLWRTRLNAMVNSFPISYEVDGRQYVAVSAGGGSAYGQTWAGLLPDVRNPPASGAALWVFALP